MTDQQIIRYSLLAVFLVVAVAYYLITHSTGKKRAEVMKKLAETMSYSYEAAGHQDLVDSAYRLPLFSQGHSKKLSNLISGTFNRLAFVLADYQYVVSGGKESSTRRQTVVIFELEKLDLPYFKLQPKNIFHKIGSIFKKKDIVFESYQQFSQRYVLTGEDETAVRRVFSDSVLSYFENNPGLNVEANRQKFMFYSSAKLVQPAQMQDFLQQGYDIFSLFANK
jgi:hypothetical protein